MRAHKLTFVSHAGEEKDFVKRLLVEIEKANVAAFFDDDMAMGTSSGKEMTSRAKDAHQAIVVLSRPFLTKEWPMKELNIFLKNKVKIHLLYYGVTPNELGEIVETYNRQVSFPKIEGMDNRRYGLLMEARSKLMLSCLGQGSWKRRGFIQTEDGGGRDRMASIPREDRKVYPQGGLVESPGS